MILKVTKRIITTFVLFIFVLTLFIQFQTIVFATADDDLDITAESAILVDFISGNVLFERDADRKIAPASMTKMMTLYIIYEAMENGLFSLDTKLTPSEKAVELSRDGFNTNIALDLDAQYTVAELIDASVVVSAAGATLVLVEHLAGSSEDFLEIMNKKVELWGIDAIFFSTVGGTTETRMTPRAMSVITRNFIIRFPEILDRAAKRSIPFAGKNYATTNELLGHYEGLDGFKTGTSIQSMENFAATAQRDGVRLISVVMRSELEHRFTDTATLLDYGFQAVPSPGTDLIIPDYYTFNDVNITGFNLIYADGSKVEPVITEIPVPLISPEDIIEPLDTLPTDKTPTENEEKSPNESLGNTSMWAIIGLGFLAQVGIGLVCFTVVKARRR